METPLYLETSGPFGFELTLTSQVEKIKHLVGPVWLRMRWDHYVIKGFDEETVFLSRSFIIHTVTFE